MTAFGLVQGLLIGLLVSGSALYAFRKLLPGISVRWLAQASASLNKPWRSSWLRRMGRWLQPKQATGSCGDGCGTCGTCGPAPAAQHDVQPLTFRPRNR
ncbi:DUF6587 family protein [Dyella tabacisoli]|uniref:Uncharacterized protein n=1 Tax=Dyella tabacisoli TaxID=2282381 RepID=A0A369US81_9GAMM|nr:DUF6587 family protein [Dyella tabacisoli]RDD83614.1 hypothetical protein DVJ77_03300 [Dyella tabacisoli]